MNWSSWREKAASSYAIVALAGMAAFGTMLRCMHLLTPGNYFLLGPDSHFFHWLAYRVMTGAGPPADAPPDAIYTLHSGLAYPLAYAANAITSAFGISPPEALDLASKLLPPLIGLVGLVAVYLVGSKTRSRRVGLFAAFTWSMLFSAVLITSSGLIDREGLSALLIMAGVLVFYFSTGWRREVRGRDIGWLLAGIGVLVIEGVLYGYWAFVGPALLLATIVVYSAVRILVEYADRLRSEKRTTARLRLALDCVNWRALAAILVVNLVFVAINATSTSWINIISSILGAEGELDVAELGGLNPGDLLSYHLFLIPIALGIYLAFKKRGSEAILFACWFLTLIALSLFARRIHFFAAPPACLLAGIGLAHIWSWLELGKLRRLKQLGGAALLVLLTLLSTVLVYPLGSDPIWAVNEEWQDALKYLREDTESEATVLSQWSWGYWILDLGERRPVVDNGYYGYPREKLRDIGLAYATSDPSEAANIMDKYGASYLVFGEIDVDFALAILGWAGLDEHYGGFPTDSLYSLSMAGNFESGGGLEVVYRSLPNGEVVVLGRVRTGPD